MKHLLPLVLLASGWVCSGASRAAESRIELLTIPTEIFASQANAKEGLSGWVYFLIVESDVNRPAVPVDLTLAYFASGREVREEIQQAAALKAIAFPGVEPARLTGEPPQVPTFWPFAFRIHTQIPAALAVDEVRARLRMLVDGELRSVEKRIAIGRFVQKTELVFPFAGRGLVTQTGVFEAGHRNRSGLYAVDAIGLTSEYSPMLRDDGRNESYAGWGRSIVAPAAGRVAIARTDRPDQPVTGTSDPSYFAPEHPSGGDPGNFVVIDHGNGEFSMLAHLQHGSVRVKTGDSVVQGQLLGALGNSGDTTGPHLHYQLQRGPRWEFSDALPVQFSNVKQLTKGSFFSAGQRDDPPRE